MENQTENALVSVIIPVYNGEKCILKALQGITKQTYRNLEILVILNGCTDRSEELVTNFAKQDSRVRPIVNEEKGLIKARKRGFEEARGIFTLNHDADDAYLRDDAIEKMVQAISESRAQICQFGHYRRYFHLLSKEYYPMAENILLTGPEIRSRTAGILEAPCRDIDGAVWSKIYSTAVLKKLVPYLEAMDNINIGEDILINALVLTDESVETVACRREAYYGYNVGVGIMSHQDLGRKLLQDYAIQKPVIAARLAETNAESSTFKALWAEAIYSYRYIIYDMLWKHCPDEGIMEQIRFAESCAHIRDAKAFFNSHPEYMYEELRFLCSDYTPEEYLADCRKNLPEVSTMQKIKQRIYRLQRFF